MLQTDKSKKFEELDQAEQVSIANKLERINAITQNNKLKYLAAYYLDQVTDAEIKAGLDEIPKSFVDSLNTNREKITYKLRNETQIVPADFLQFEQIIHALAAAKATPMKMEKEEQLDLSNLTNPIEIFDINCAQDAMKWYTVLPWQGTQWCITWPQSRSNQWWPYRLRYGSTFYIVVDNKLKKSNPFHAVAVDHTESGLKITDLRNGSESSYFDTSYPELARANGEPRSYNEYLLEEHGVDSSRFPYKPLTEEENKSYNFFSAKRNLKDFKELFTKDTNLIYENAPLKYIQFPHELSDDQFKYLIDIKREDLVREYLNGVFLINDIKLSMLNNNLKNTYERKENRMIEDAIKINKLKDVLALSQNSKTLKKIIAADPNLDFSNKLEDAINQSDLESVKLIVENALQYSQSKFKFVTNIDILEYLWNHCTKIQDSVGIKALKVAIEIFSAKLIEKNFDENVFKRIVNLPGAKQHIRMGGDNAGLIKDLYERYDLTKENFFRSFEEAKDFIEHCALNDPAVFRFILENQLDRKIHYKFIVDYDSYNIAKEDYINNKQADNMLDGKHFYDKIDFKSTLNYAIADDRVKIAEQLIEENKIDVKSLFVCYPNSIEMYNVLQKLKNKSQNLVVIKLSKIIDKAVRNWNISMLEWLSKNMDVESLDSYYKIKFIDISDNPTDKLRQLVQKYNFPLESINFQTIISYACQDNNIEVLDLCAEIDKENFIEILSSINWTSRIELKTIRYLHEKLKIPLDDLPLTDYMDFSHVEFNKEEKFKIVQYLMDKNYFNETNSEKYSTYPYEFSRYWEMNFPIKNINIKELIEKMHSISHYDTLLEMLSKIKNYNGIDGVKLFNEQMEEELDGLEEYEEFANMSDSDQEELKDDLKISVDSLEQLKALLDYGFKKYSISLNEYFKKCVNTFLNNPQLDDFGLFEIFDKKNLYDSITYKIPTSYMNEITFLKLVEECKIPVELIDIFQSYGLIENAFYGNNFDFLERIRPYILQMTGDRNFVPLSVEFWPIKILIDLFERNLGFLADISTYFKNNSPEDLKHKTVLIEYLINKDPMLLVKSLSEYLRFYKVPLYDFSMVNSLLTDEIKSELRKQNEQYEQFLQNDFSGFILDVSSKSYPWFRNLILNKKIDVNQVASKYPAYQLQDNSFADGVDLLKLGASPLRLLQKLNDLPGAGTKSTSSPWYKFWWLCMEYKNNLHNAEQEF